MTKKCFVIENDKYDTISEAVCNLYSWIEILELYSEYKGVRNQEIANIHSFVCKMQEEIRKISACI